MLRVDFYDVRADGVRVETSEGLKTVWTSGTDVASPLYNADGGYRGHVSFAYSQGRPLWVTAPEGGVLIDHADGCTDSWSEVENLPPYRTDGELRTRTSIIIPLKYGNRVVGVVNLELAEFRECSSSARQELALVAEALSRIIFLYETSQNQSEDRRTAFESIKQRRRRVHCPLDKPKVFVASTVSNPSRKSETHRLARPQPLVVT